MSGARLDRRDAPRPEIKRCLEGGAARFRGPRGGLVSGQRGPRAASHLKSQILRVLVERTTSTSTSKMRRSKLGSEGCRPHHPDGLRREGHFVGRTCISVWKARWPSRPLREGLRAFACAEPRWPHSFMLVHPDTGLQKTFFHSTRHGRGLQSTKACLPTNILFFLPPH